MRDPTDYAIGMPRNLVALGFFLLTLLSTAGAASKPHLLTFGKSTPVKLFVGPAEDKGLDISVRPLYVDGKLREFTTGEPHDVTERMLVVRRAFRLNDRLPEEAKNVRWRWQRGNWLLVDRETGRISDLKLPEFDPFYSDASWYRDYAAYCGISDSGEKVYAVVAQLGRKKPVVHKDLGAARQGDMPDSECSAPKWQRQPARVTFLPKDRPEISFEVRGHTGDVASSDEEEKP